MDFDEWLQRLQPEVKGDVGAFVDACRSFFEERRDYFKSTGFYVVGSSLVKNDFRDIDFVVVGLDFRQIFDYTPGFLGDISSLVKNYGRLCRRKNCDHVKCTEFKGKFYNGGFDKEMGFTTDLSHGKGHSVERKKLLDELEKRLKEALPEYQSESWRDHPFLNGPYLSECVGYNTLVSQMEFKPSYGSDKPPLNLIFHAHNLLLSSWKRIQKKDKWSFIPIMEYLNPENDTVRNRPRFDSDDMPLPSFIDSKGRRMLSKSWGEDTLEGQLNLSLYPSRFKS